MPDFHCARDKEQHKAIYTPSCLFLLQKEQVWSGQSTALFILQNEESCLYSIHFLQADSCLELQEEHGRGGGGGGGRQYHFY